MEVKEVDEKVVIDAEPYYPIHKGTVALIKLKKLSSAIAGDHLVVLLNDGHGTAQYFFQPRGVPYYFTGGARPRGYPLSVSLTKPRYLGGQKVTYTVIYDWVALTLGPMFLTALCYVVIWALYGLIRLAWARHKLETTG